MSNRDHDQNVNQNPKSGAKTPGQKPGQMEQRQDKTPGQQGDPANRGRGGHNPQGGGASLGKDPKAQDSTKR